MQDQSPDDSVLDYSVDSLASETTVFTHVSNESTPQGTFVYIG